MWEYKESDVVEEVATGSEWINKSGCYDCSIISAEIKKSNSSQSEGLNLLLESGGNKVYTTLWYKKKDGSENEFATKQLNRMMFLCKLKGSDIKKDKVDDKEFIKAFENKKIGVILNIELKDENKEVAIKDFYDLASRKTTDEIKKGSESKNYEYWLERYKDAIEIKIEKKSKEVTKQEEVDKDSFPF